MGKPVRLDLIWTCHSRTVDKSKGTLEAKKNADKIELIFELPSGLRVKAIVDPENDEFLERVYSELANLFPKNKKGESATTDSPPTVLGLL